MHWMEHRYRETARLLTPFPNDRLPPLATLLTPTNTTFCQQRHDVIYPQLRHSPEGLIKRFPLQERQVYRERSLGPGRFFPRQNPESDASSGVPDDLYLSLIPDAVGVTQRISYHPAPYRYEVMLILPGKLLSFPGRGSVRQHQMLHGALSVQILNGSPQNPIILKIKDLLPIVYTINLHADKAPQETVTGIEPFIL